MATQPSAALVSAVVSDLREDEGVVPYAYHDSRGFLTIGVGRLIDQRQGGHLADDEIDFLLSNDIEVCVADLATLPAWQGVQGNPVRMRGLINMRFQLGAGGIRAFTQSMADIAAQNWAQAAIDLKNSSWYTQTPERAARVISMICEGVRPSS